MSPYSKGWFKKLKSHGGTQESIVLYLPELLLPQFVGQCKIND